VPKLLVFTGGTGESDRFSQKATVLIDILSSDHSHSAEVTSGYYNTNMENAYLNIAKMFADYDTNFDFTGSHSLSLPPLLFSPFIDLCFLSFQYFHLNASR
jgi:hypothetical protein